MPQRNPRKRKSRGTYAGDASTIRGLKKQYKKSHGVKLARQVVRTAKGYARSKRLVRAESLIPAKLKRMPNGTYKVYVAPGQMVKLRANPKRTYDLRVPPTRDQGSYNVTVSGYNLAEARADALWQYNSARAHDGFGPIKRLPSGTKITPRKV